MINDKFKDALNPETGVSIHPPAPAENYDDLTYRIPTSTAKTFGEGALSVYMGVHDMTRGDAVDRAENYNPEAGNELTTTVAPTEGVKPPVQPSHREFLDVLNPKD